MDLDEHVLERLWSTVDSSVDVEKPERARVLNEVIDFLSSIDFIDNMPRALYLRGYAAHVHPMKLNDPRLGRVARESLRRVSELVDSDFLSRYFLAEHLVDVGDYDDAVRMLESCDGLSKPVQFVPRIHELIACARVLSSGVGGSLPELQSYADVCSSHQVEDVYPVRLLDVLSRVGPGIRSYLPLMNRLDEACRCNSFSQLGVSSSGPS